jgi:hypothetical protein
MTYPRKSTLIHNFPCLIHRKRKPAIEKAGLSDACPDGLILCCDNKFTEVSPLLGGSVIQRSLDLQDISSDIGVSFAKPRYLLIAVKNSRMVAFAQSCANLRI